MESYRRRLFDVLLDRRTLLRSAAIGASLPIFGGLLSACGDSSIDDDSVDTDDSDVTDDEPTVDDDADIDDEETVDDAVADDTDDQQLALRVGMTTTVDIDDVDPHLRTGRPIAIMENMMEPLVGFDGESVDPRPLLSESWESTDDGLVWTMHLRQGVAFHDGSAFTADSVAYSFERINYYGQSPAAPLIEDKIVEIETIDDFTMEFTVNPGAAPFLQLLTMILIVSREAGEENDDGDMAQSFFRDNPIGTGPYVMSEWERGSAMTLTKFDDYWGGWESGQFTRVVNQVIPEASTQLLMLERGDLDIALRFPTENLPALRENPEITVDETEGFRVLLLRMNMVAGHTQDVRVRRAISHCLDYDGVVAAQPGFMGPRTGPIPPEMMDGWIPDGMPEFDLDEAARLFNEAEVPDGTTFSVFVADGADHQLTSAQILQAGLQAVGHDLEINVLQFADWSQRIVNWIEEQDSDPEQAPSDMFNLVVPPRIPEGWGMLWFNFHSDATRGAGRNWYQYSNTEVDALIDQGSQLTDQAERNELWKQAVEMIVEDVPDVFLGNELRVSVRRSHVEGYEFHPAWFPEVHFYPLRHADHA
jgi:peptide/nickel transport system substrate-binding protein